MKIGDIDKNLKVETNLELPELKWFPPLDTLISLHGLCRYKNEDGFLRIPLDIAKATSEGVFHLTKNTAGGWHKCFRTDSPLLPALGGVRHLSEPSDALIAFR